MRNSGTHTNSDGAYQVSDSSRPVAAEVITCGNVQTLTGQELSILRQLSQAEPLSVFQISAGLTETWSVVEIIRALERMRRLKLVIKIFPRGPVKYLRTSAGTDALALTKSGVAV